MQESRLVWDTALAELQSQVSRANFEMYLKDTFAIGERDGTFFVGVPGPFALAWLETRFSPICRKTLSRILGHPVDVRFVLQPRTSGPADLGPLQEAAARTPRSTTRRPPPSSPFNPRYTFATFVVGNSNRLAHAASLAVAENPAQAYNPLFIYGDVGLGKTHLLHAIGQAILAKGLPVVYVSSETFTNELIESIREHRMEEFRAKYRQTGALLVDDIQFIAGRERTQEEFFHTFNAVHEGGGQIVLSSDRAPKAIPTLEARLQTRFEWGLIADIQRPDLETRIAILRSKTDGQPVPVPEDVIEFIAHKVQSNIRELEGSLNRVLAYARLQRAPVTLELAAEALKTVLGDSARPQARPEAVLQAVARHFGITVDDLRGQHRDKKVVVPRQLAMYLLREDARLSLPEIGQLLGGRDHSTVLHGYEKVRTELQAEGRIKDDLRAVREALLSAERK